jgi:hypothetical protein
MLNVACGGSPDVDEMRADWHERAPQQYVAIVSWMGPEGSRSDCLRASVRDGDTPVNSEECDLDGNWIPIHPPLDPMEEMFTVMEEANCDYTVEIDPTYGYPSKVMRDCAFDVVVECFARGDLDLTSCP